MADQEASLLLRIKETGSEALEHVVVTVGEIGEAIHKVVEFMMSFVEASAKQEEAMNSLSASMVQNGMFSAHLKEKYTEMGEAMAKNTIFSNEQVTAAQAVLQSMIGQREVTDGLMKATADLAARKKIDLVAASEMVGRAVANENNVLQRVGIQYDTTSDKGERMRRVINAIETQFGGAAAAQTQGLGVLKQMENAYEELKETVGAKFAPVVEAVAIILRDMFTQMRNGSPVIDSLSWLFKESAIQGMLFARDFQVVGQVVGNVLGGMFAALKEASQGNFKAAWDNIKSIATVTMDDIVETNKKTWEKVAAIDNAETTRKEEMLKKEEADIDASNKRKEQMRTEIDLQAANKQLEKDKIAQDNRIRQSEMIGQDRASQLRLAMQQTDKEISIAESYHQRKALVDKRGHLAEALAQANADKAKLAIHQKTADAMVFITDALHNILITAFGEHNKAAFIIQKAGAIAQAFVATELAAANALTVPPPPVGIALSGIVEAIGMANVAAIAATAIQGLATGGIVPATPGGSLYTLGEGGKSEAVIPLDDPATKEKLGMGGNVTLIFQGPILGDERQAEEFAKVIDKAMFRLRQTNQSLAFDTSLA